MGSKEQKLFGNLIQLMNSILLSEDDIITMENFIHRLMELILRILKIVSYNFDFCYGRTH